jgi:nucleotide-binding universal stress UspA family protein
MSIRILEPNADLPEGAILVPLSLHDAESDTALLLHAAELAASRHSPLLVLHAIHEPADMPGMYLNLGNAEVVMPMAQIAESICVDRLKALQSRHGNLKALQQLDLYLIPGLPENRIVEVAERAKCSTIVIPSHQSTLLDRLFANSITESVLRHASCAVTLVAVEKETQQDTLKAAAKADAGRAISQPATLPLTQRHA